MHVQCGNDGLTWLPRPILFLCVCVCVVRCISHRCRGRGRRRGARELAVAVPAGVESGQLLRLRGEGHAGRRGAPAGDLIVQLMVGVRRVRTADG